MAGVTMVFVAALTACGGGDADEAHTDEGSARGSDVAGQATSPAPGGQDAGTETAAPREIVHSATVTVRDGAIEVSPAELDAGDMTVLVVNTDDEFHAVEIYSEHYGRWRTVRLAPGGTAELTMRMAAADYQVFCPLDNHRETLTASLRVR